MRRGIAALFLPVLLLSRAPAAHAEGPKAQPPRTLRLIFAGDIMGHDVNYGMEDFRDIYRGVSDVFLAGDLAFANLEFPLDPFRPPAGYPTFNGTGEYLAAAVDAGINLFSTANNHAFDGGEEGIFQTIRALESARTRRTGPFAWSGTRGNPHRQFQPETVIVKGIRVGFIAVTQFVNEPDHGRYVHAVDYAEAEQADEFVASVREVSPLYDLFIVSYHGDREYDQAPSSVKRAFFRRLLDAGAHIVVGHHPHVVQGYDVVEAGGSRRLAMYSMGNLISGMTWSLSPSEMQGMAAAVGESYMLGVDVLCGTGGCSVTGVDPVPIANYTDERSQMVVARMSDLAEGAVKISPSWQAYYKRRLALMREYLARFGRASDPSRSASLP